MACTVDELLAKGAEAVNRGVKYIYGAKWQVLSAAQIDALRDMYGSNCVWWSDTEKAGSLCCDCSGLISAATGRVLGTWGLENEATDRVDISAVRANPAAYRGWLLGLSGHVGINVGDGTYYALDGSARNAVHLPLSYNSWRYAYKCADVDYGSGAASGGSTGGGTSSSPAAEVRYRVHVAGGGWLDEMVNHTDTGGSNDTFAGETGKPIDGLAINMAGWYQVQTQQRGWLEPVRGYDVNDSENGYAGMLGGDPITAVRCYYETPNPNVTGWLAIEYQVANVGGSFFTAMHDTTDTGGSGDDYAGDGGQIDRFRAQLIKA